VAWVNCAHFFPKSNNTRNNQPYTVDDYRKRILADTYRKCPEDFLRKLELKKYAQNTAKTYIGLFELFINHYKDKELKSRSRLTKFKSGLEGKFELK